MIFDTHTHYDDRAFDQDRETLFNELAADKIDTIVNIGADMESSRQTLLLTKQYDFIYGAVGVHPSETKDLTEADMDQLLAWSQEEKIVAIGEIGLDYHYPEPDKELQKKWFIRQLVLAKDADLPVVIHSREAAADTLEIIREYGPPKRGVIHCFSYTKEMAAEYVRLGYYIGIGGVITFKNAKKLIEAAEQIPLDRIVLETDCPYLAPEPHRGQRNSSLYLPYVAEALSEIKHVSYEEIVNVTRENACKLYQLSPGTAT